MSTSVLPASHPFAAGSSRTYSPPSVGTTRRALVTQSTFCASWARDVAAITRLTSASASDSKIAPSPTPSPPKQGQPMLLEAAIITEPLPRTTYGPVPPGRERSQGSPNSSPGRGIADTTVKYQSHVGRACWSPTPSYRSTCSKATEKAEVDHFIASLPSKTMFGSVSRRGGQTLAERHLAVEIEGAEVRVAQRV